MHDADHDALPVSLDGADATITNRMLVVATLTALLLAGSAMVYRARPFLLTAVSNTAASEKESGALSLDREQDKRKAVGQGNSAGEGVVGGAENPGPTPPALATKPVLDSDSSKDSKSSRSKDRRRRGKDPLKEILKGGKKAKILTPSLTAPSKSVPSTPVKTSQCDYNNEPENDNEPGDDDDVPEYEQHASPASSSASLLPDSTTHSLSRAKGKRAQRNPSIDLTAGTHLSSTHSRAASNSEVSQKQHLESDPQAHYHDHPPSYLASVSASEDNDGRPHSRTSSYSSSSLSHPHTNPHPPIVSMNEKHIDPGRSSHLRTHSAVPRFDENNQAHRTDLAPGSDSSRVEDAGEGEGYSGKSVWLRDSSTSPSIVTTTTTTARLVDADGFSKPKSKSKTKASTSSASSSVSMDTTTTTGTTSMTSSLMMTRATSPSLSDMSKRTPIVATHDNHDNDTPTPPLATGTKAKNSRKAQFVANSSPKKGDNKPPNSWSWDGAGAVDDPSSSALDAAAANIIASVTGVERSSKERGKDSDSYKRPPRLQRVKGGAATFSAVATSSTGLTTAASHPASLYSQTNTSFAGLAGSVSFSAASPLSSLSPTGVGEGEVVMEEELSTREREEEETFTFPTLNPTTTSGSSRTRSSVADINSSNNFNNNTPQINNTRRARPPTPSRSNLSSASHTPPPSSSSPLSQPASISSSSGVNSGSAPNPNANGGGVLLSTQTQLASLRGALEAARLREEKHKAEMERVLKEVDVLRWEHANSRRGEIELQTHVRQLMQQLQTYASLFASMAPQLNAQYQQYYFQQQQQLQQAQQQLANGSSAGGGTGTAGAAATESVNSDGDASATPDGNAGSSSMMSSTAQEPTPASSSTLAQPLQGPNQTPAQQPPNPPPPLHIPTFPTFQTNGVNAISSPLGVLSPSLGVSYPGSPSFFPYTMSPHSHALPTPHTHPLLFAQLMQQQQQYQQQLNTTTTQAQVQSQAQPSPHQANLFSMHFPPGPHPLMMSPQQHHQLYATHGAGSSAFGMASGPSSVAGTSSVGSLSPDLGTSPSPGGAAVAVNGKRRTRTRTQTSNGRMSARGGVGPAVGVWEERAMGDPWVGGGVGVEENVIEEEPEMEGADGLLDGSLRRVNGHPSGAEEEEGEEGFSEGGFNELLADAILKRPESIRVRSFPKRDRLAELGGLESEKGSSPTKDEHDATVVVEQEEMERMAEFTFPSLSGLGNVHYRSDSAKVNGDCSVVFGTSPEVEFPAVPSVAPDALASLELLEDDKASLVLPPLVKGLDQSSVEPVIDVAPTENQEAAVESESSPDLEMITPSKEGIVSTPTESISHSDLPITPPALDVVTLSSEQ